MSERQISVVMSVWNARETLGRAVESILGQSFGGWEFLIVNDGSDDGSGGLLEEFARRDSRIRLVRQKNAGLTRALVHGCAEARGEWIARQDADDWSESSRLEKCLALAGEHPGCTMVGSWADYHGPAGELLEVVRRPENPEEATRGLLHGEMGPPAHGTLMFRNAAYQKAGGYRQEFYFGQDLDLWLRMGQEGSLSYVQESLYHYVLSPGAISGRFSGAQNRFGELARLCLKAREEGGSEKLFLEEAEKLSAEARQNKALGSPASQAGSNYRIGVRLARRGDRAAASRYFLEALRLQPMHWRALLRLLASKIPR
ncbi:MAG: glycosyltransferase family 2 protein [Verrucomicrobiae bacterium]